MCGRFTLQEPDQSLQQLFDFVLPGPSWEPARTARPRYNIAPTQPILVIRGGRDARRWGAWARWGMPAAKGRLAINTRSETVFDRPAFRNAVRRGRVVVPASGFLEWKRIGRHRVPFHITRPEGAPLAFAGVAIESMVDGERRLSCAVLTTRANADVQAVHNRQPVILDEEGVRLWLDPTVESPNALQYLFQPVEEGQLVLTSVSPRVNRVDNDDPECHEPTSPPPEPPDRPAAVQLGFDY